MDHTTLVSGYISVPVSDIDRSVAWYRDRAGFEIKKTGNTPYIWVRHGDLRILLDAMQEVPEYERGVSPHLVVLHTDDPAQTLERLLANGVDAIDAGGAVCFSDPDGNQYQFASREDDFPELDEDFTFDDPLADGEDMDTDGEAILPKGEEAIRERVLSVAESIGAVLARLAADPEGDPSLGFEMMSRIGDLQALREHLRGELAMDAALTILNALFPESDRFTGDQRDHLREAHRACENGLAAFGLDASLLIRTTFLQEEPESLDAGQTEMLTDARDEMNDAFSEVLTDRQREILDRLPAGFGG